MNGTYYVVSAWVVSGATAVYTFDLSTGLFTEITNPGNATPSSWGGDTTGKTQLSNTTADVTFCVHTVPRRVIAGSVSAPKDVLSINNLYDYPLIWNPTQAAGMRVVQHRSITVPGGGTQFNYFATFSTFFPVAAAPVQRATSRRRRTAPRRSPVG